MADCKCSWCGGENNSLVLVDHEKKTVRTYCNCDCVLRDLQAQRKLCGDHLVKMFE